MWAVNNNNKWNSLLTFFVRQDESVPVVFWLCSTILKKIPTKIISFGFCSWAYSETEDLACSLWGIDSCRSKVLLPDMYFSSDITFSKIWNQLTRNAKPTDDVYIFSNWFSMRVNTYLRSFVRKINSLLFFCILVLLYRGVLRPSAEFFFWSEFFCRMFGS